MLRLLYQFPTWMQRLYPGVLWRKDQDKKVVYLTFDDGPIPECTPQILDILAQYGVKATFFMVAENAVRYPHLLERIRQEGHSVGNHTYHHLRGCQVATSRYLDDVEKAAQIYMLTAHLPRINTIRDDQMVELAEFFGVNYRKDFLNL